jgi:photosystem II stability/assembly factor-like uncharacterized protein
MKSITFILPLLILSQVVSAQWTWQNPLPQGNPLSNFELLDDKNIIAVGFNGTVIKSTDGGNTWKIVSFPSQEDLSAISFIDSQTGWLANRSVYKTMDGGLNWSIINTFENQYLYYIQFLTQNLGYGLAFSSTTGLKKTTDGGMTWMHLNDQEFQKIHFVDGLNGWASGTERHGFKYYGTILRTTDGGLNWQTVLTDSTNPFEDMFVLSNNLVWAVHKSGYLYRSTDGGSTWQKHNLIDENVSSVFFINALTGYLFTWNFDSGSKIYKTTDGGENWLMKHNLNSPSEFKIKFYNEDIGIVSGRGVAILRTEDGGETWINLQKGVTSSLYKISFLDSQNGLAVGTGGVILKTTDGGKNWIQMNSGTSVNISSFDFYNSQRIIAVGDSGTVLISTDFGETWEFSVIDSNPLTSIKLAGNYSGWICGANGTILKTVDGGKTWEKLNSPTTRYLFSTFFIDSLTGWIGGEYAFIAKTADGGDTWITQMQGSSSFDGGGVSIFFIDSVNGWSVGDMNSIYKTTDGGNYWRRIPLDVPYIPVISDVFFFDKLNGWAAGDGGTILKTTDGGETWSFPENITGNAIHSICSPDTNALILAGSGGTILKYQLGNVVSVGNAQGLESYNYYLLQNYPNPFNPITTITYTLKEKSKVTLTVFDILGRELEVLVNTTQDAGEYKVPFSASHLASGVYLYRLRVDDKTFVKKMLMMK